VKFRFDSAAMFALMAVAFAGVAHRLGGPVLYGASPSVDLGQMSAWLASVAAVLMAVLKVLQQVQSFVEMLRKPIGPDAQPVYLGPADPKVGHSSVVVPYSVDNSIVYRLGDPIAAVKARLAELKAEPPTKPEIPPGYVECRLCGNPKIEGQVCSRCDR
jgi:hypothetical protein